jgi:hypothetical protein
MTRVTSSHNRGNPQPGALGDPRQLIHSPDHRNRNVVLRLADRKRRQPGSTSTGTCWADGEIGTVPLNTQTFLLIANTSRFAGRVRVKLLFEDGGAEVSRDFDVLPQSRRTIAIASDFPEANGRGFGALIESLPDQGTGVTAEIGIERAMYSDTPQESEARSRTYSPRN